MSDNRFNDFTKEELQILRVGLMHLKCVMKDQHDKIQYLGYETDMFYRERGRQFIEIGKLEKELDKKYYE